MPLYAARSWRTVRQVVADLFVVCWAVGWWLVATGVNAVIKVLAVPARAIADAAEQSRSQMTRAADEAGRVPGVGSTARVPFDSVARTSAEISAAANAQVAGIEQVATVVGWVVFSIPVLMMIAIWLPIRLRFIIRARAAQRFIDAVPDLDLFALRAMATQPMPILAAISDDPVGAWRRGDRHVINRLAEAELRSSGLRPPAGYR